MDKYLNTLNPTVRSVLRVFKKTYVVLRTRTNRDARAAGLRDTHFCLSCHVLSFVGAGPQRWR